MLFTLLVCLAHIQPGGGDRVHIPAGNFLMGSDRSPDCAPARQVYVSEFWMGKNLVTVAEFRKFCDSGFKYDWEVRKPAWGYQDNLPMVNVSWFDASAYAKWAGGRLPTEAEWEKAARGEDGRNYPWGNKFDPTRLCSSVGSALTSPVAVGSFNTGASPYGCLDMSGNAAQWCQDWYSDKGYAGLPDKNPRGASTGTERVLRCGNWFFRKPVMFSTWFRGNQPPEFFYKGIGIRVAYDKP